MQNVINQKMYVSGRRENRSVLNFFPKVGDKRVFKREMKLKKGF